MAKILLVEDDKNLLEIYGARLMAEGYEIVTAQDGEEGLAVASRERPDLIITDAMMPRVSGLQFLDILRSTPQTADIKVIAMTALSQAEDRAQFEKLGVERFLVKSQITLEDVTRIVAEVLNGASASAAVDPLANAPAADPPASQAAAVVSTPILVTDPVTPVPSEPVSVPVVDQPVDVPVVGPPAEPVASVDDPVVVPPTDPVQLSPEQIAPATPVDAPTTEQEQSEIHQQIENFIQTSPLVNTPQPIVEPAPPTDSNGLQSSQPHDIAL